MKREYFLVSLFFLIAAVFVYLFYKLIIPFFAPIAWAAVFVILFRPLYDRLLRRLHSPNLTSLIMSLFIVVLIIGPLGYILLLLLNQAAAAVAGINTLYRAGKFDDFLRLYMPWLEGIRLKLSQFYDLTDISVDELIKEGLDKVTGFVLQQATWIVTNAAKAIFYFVIMIFTMFYFFRDGAQLVAKTKRLMPIPDEQIERVFGRLRDVIYATMYGGIVVAVIQGVLGGLLFAVMGLPSAIFWGAVMVFLSIIPFLGAFVVYLPAGVFLMLSGSYVKGILMIAIGTIVISQSDNIIRPYLISGRTEMHPLLLFFAIMGGVAMFGLLGVVVGPLIAAVFVAIIRLFEVRLHTPEDVAPPEPDTPPDI